MSNWTYVQQYSHFTNPMSFENTESIGTQRAEKWAFGLKGTAIPAQTNPMLYKGTVCSPTL